MSKIVERFFLEERGQDLIEYGLLLGIVTAVSVATISAIGTRVRQFYTELCSAIGASC
jgi:Flp pilus assembly pilin Flp